MRTRVKRGDRVILNGGEPTLHHDFIAILRLAMSTGAEVVIYTNGTLLEELSSEMTMLWGRGRITVPIHGRASLHDEITQLPKSYDKTLQGLKCLNQASGQYIKELKFIVTANMVEQDFDMASWMKENGLALGYDVVVTGQVNTRKSQFHHMWLPCNKVTGGYVARQLEHLAQMGVMVKLYDICVKSLPSQLRCWLIREPLHQHEQYQHFIFFDNQCRQGRQVVFSEVGRSVECAVCKYKTHCRQIRHSYYVLQISAGGVRLVME